MRSSSKKPDDLRDKGLHRILESLELNSTDLQMIGRILDLKRSILVKYIRPVCSTEFSSWELGFKHAITEQQLELLLKRFGFPKPTHVDKLPAPYALTYKTKENCYFLAVSGVLEYSIKSIL